MAQPYLYHQGELSSNAPTRSPNATIGRKQGQLFCSHALGAAHLHPSLQSQFHVLPSQGTRPTLPHTAASKGLGQLSCSLNFWAVLLSPLPSGPAPLCCPLKAQGPLSRMLQLMRGRDSSPALTTLGPALQTMVDGKG